MPTADFAYSLGKSPYSFFAYRFFLQFSRTWAHRGISVDREVDKTVAPRGVFGFRAEIVSRSELSSREPQSRQKSLVLRLSRPALPRVPPSREKAEKHRKNEPCAVLRCVPSLPLPSLALFFALCRSFSLPLV